MAESNLRTTCTELGLDPSGLTDEQVQALIDARKAEVFTIIGRAFDASDPMTVDQLPNHPIVGPWWLWSRRQAERKEQTR